MSSNSWGGQPTAWGGMSPAISSLSSWGTTALPKLSNTPTTIPLSFGSSAQTAVHVGSPSWEVGSRSTSSHTVFSPYTVVSGSVVSNSCRRSFNFRTKPLLISQAFHQSDRLIRRSQLTLVCNSTVPTDWLWISQYHLPKRLLIHPWELPLFLLT